MNHSIEFGRSSWAGANWTTSPGGDYDYDRSVAVVMVVMVVMVVTVVMVVKVGSSLVFQSSVSTVSDVRAQHSRASNSTTRSVFSN